MRIGRVLAGAACAAAVAGIALSGSPALADPSTVSAQLGISTMTTSDSSSGTNALYLFAGQSVTFSAATPPGLGSSFRVKLDSSALPGGSAVVWIGKPVTYTLASTGTFAFSWTPYDVIQLHGTNRASVVVAGAEGSPSGSNSVPPSSPGGSPPASSPGSSGRPGSPGSVPSFGAPSDHGLAASTSPLSSASRAATSSAASAGSSAATNTTPSPSTSTTVVAGIAKSSSPSRPVGLAVVAIVAFACVAGWYAYQYFGLDALRRG